MPKKYSNEAIERARGLYIKFGGTNFDAIEREMRKQYPGWSKVNLVNRKEKAYRGRVAREKLGWVDYYGFDKSLKMHLKELATEAANDEQDLYAGIRATRKELQSAVVAGQATRDELYAYRDFCKLEIEARKNLDLSRDNFETFVAGYEKLLTWSPDLDVQLAKLLVKHTERFAVLAQAHYGKTETDFDGAGDREDEGGGEPFSLLDRD